MTAAERLALMMTGCSVAGCQNLASAFLDIRNRDGSVMRLRRCSACAPDARQVEQLAADLRMAVELVPLPDSRPREVRRRDFLRGHLWDVTADSRVRTSRFIANRGA